jgi:hypothetical protein
MTFKKTVSSLSFVLAASVSSIALAQGLGVATNAQVGIGSAPAAAGGQTSIGANVGAQAGANPNSSLNQRSETAIGSDTKGAASVAGSSVNGATQATESSAKSAVGTGADTAAAAQADAHDTPIKIANAKKTGHAKTPTKAKVDLDASTKLKEQNPN